MQPCHQPPPGWMVWRTTSSPVPCCCLRMLRRNCTSRRYSEPSFRSVSTLSTVPDLKFETLFVQTLERDVGHIAEDVKLSQALLAQSSGLGQEDRTLLEDNLDCLNERLGALGCALGQRCDHMRSRAHELTAYQVAILLDFFFSQCIYKF